MHEPSRPTLHVYTFKEGLLARLGHDLRFSASDFTVCVERGHVKVRVALKSLTVDGAMKQGALDLHTLDSSDRSKILEHAQRDVLELSRDGEAAFEGEARAETPTRYVVHGSLRLHGQSHGMNAQVFVEGDTLVASAELRPSEWGIAPFRALAGAIRVEDRVRVELRAPLPAEESNLPLHQRSFSIAFP